MDSFESRMNPRLLAESEKGMLWEPRVIESGRERVEGFKEDEKREREELLFCCRSVWADFPPSLFFCCCVSMHWVLWWGWSLHWEERISGAVCHLQKLMVYRVVIAMIWERGVVYRTKRMGPSTEPWGTPCMNCDGDEDELLTEVDWYLECSRLNAQNRVQTGEENLVVKSAKSGRKMQQKKNRKVVIVQSGENTVSSA